jgi:hypothetical protein
MIAVYWRAEFLAERSDGGALGGAGFHEASYGGEEFQANPSALYHNAAVVARIPGATRHPEGAKAVGHQACPCGIG